ncbi:PqqD family protein [Candidatus Amesbacteria bacterium]|nr:PqqD family protein [Candidatus Amesbacteria bacterium]
MRLNTSKSHASVLFCPLIDKVNDYNTIVYNVNSNTNHKVNSFGYFILEIVENNPGISLDDLVDKYSRKVGKPIWKIRNQVESFVKEMMRENIVLID